MFGLVAAYGLQANADTGPALIEAPVADRPIVVNVQLVTPDGRLTASASTTTQAPVALVADASSQLPAAATPAQPQVRVLAAPPVQVVAPAQAGPVAQTAPPAQAAAPVQARTNGSR